MGKFNYADNSYWCENRDLYPLLAAIHKAYIPASGEVIEDLPAVEDLRKANNAYYDLYNNGGGNRDADILFYSGIDCNYEDPINNWGSEAKLLGGYGWDEVAEAFEPAMDALVLAAAKEVSALGRPIADANGIEAYELASTIIKVRAYRKLGYKI